MDKEIQALFMGGGVMPTICSIDWKPGKGLVLKKWKRK